MVDRQRAGNESPLPLRAVAALYAAPTIHDKLHRVARLQVLLSALQFFAARDRLPVYGHNYVSSLQADVIGEGTRLHADHLYALLLQVHVRVHLLGQVLDPHAEAHGRAGVFRSSARLAAAAEALGEYLRQVANYDLHIALLAITQHAEIQRIAHRGRGHRVYELVAVVDLFAVDRNNHVTCLDARLLAGTARLNAIHEDAILRARNPQVRPRLVQVASLEGD